MELARCAAGAAISVHAAQERRVVLIVHGALQQFSGILGFRASPTSAIMNVTRPKARPATVTNGQDRTHPYIAAAAATIGALDGFPKEMAVRPSQIRASAAESALMIRDACNFQDQYKYLEMPVSIIAGEDDRLSCIRRRRAQ
jgi:hypothetical protein